MSERWRGVLAALMNPDLRAVLAESMAAPPLTESRRQRAIERLAELGLVRETDSGELEFDDALVRGILSENPPVKRTGPERFLDAEGRIDRYPAQAADRRDLLRWIADRAFSPGEVLSEQETNDRLSAFGADTAVLRRYLVDEGVLERTTSGSEYALADESAP